MQRIMQLKIIVVVLGMLISFPKSISFAQNTPEALGTDKYLYGIAAMYEDQFEGKTTASGSIYSSQSLTAGHRSLPFGTRIEVENLSNGKKAQVIINDRGPFEKNRVLNLSKRTAEILEFITEGTTFVKITILELGSSLPSPLGLPEPPLGQDIPQQATPVPTNNIPTPVETPATVPTPIEAPAPAPVEEPVTEDTTPVTGLSDYNYNDFSLLDEAALFADLENEIDFMNDTTLTNEDPQLKAQNLPTNVDNAPPAAPITGFEPTQDILINDPLANITIPEQDEFVAVPNLPISNTAPYALTEEEQQLLNDNALTDPFADLFNDSTEPFPFQNEVGSTLANSPLTNATPANNIDGNSSGFTNLPPATPSSNPPATPSPVFQTNTVVVTNFVTNTVENTNTPSPAQNTTPTDSLFDDFYYNDTNSTPSTPMGTSTPMNNNTPAETAPQPTPSNMSPSTPAPSMPNTPAAPSAPAPLEFQKLGNHYVIQLGAFSKQKNALELYEALRKSGFNTYITDVKVKGRNLMRVRVGYFQTVDEALQVSTQLKENYNLDNRIIQVDFSETQK